jgi:hypothetical protein
MVKVSRGRRFSFNKTKHSLVEDNNECASKSSSKNVSFVNHYFIISVVFVSPIEYEFSHQNSENDDAYHEHHQRVDIEDRIKKSE